MAKYRDKTGMGKSGICPKQKGERESGSDRHHRRLSFNTNHLVIVRNFCVGMGVFLTVKNYGQHWEVKSKDKIVEWWPSSAKVVINKQWKKGIHCHDYEQFIKILKKQL